MTNHKLTTALTALLTAFTVCARESVSLNDGWTFRTAADTAATPVHLPHCWNADAYVTKNYYRGEGVYRKRLEIPAVPAGQRLYLIVDGAATKSRVEIDGAEVGRHTGGYSSHVLDITSAATPGAVHDLVITVDNADPDIPPYSADYTFMGGLYRDVRLTAMPPVHLDITAGPEEGFVVDTDADGRLTVSGRLVNDSSGPADARITVRLYAPDGSRAGQWSRNLRVKAGSDRSFTLSGRTDGPVSLWSPESPALYRVEVVTEVPGQPADTASCTTAFRSFGFDDEGRFLLNGRPYKLRGMCRHQDQRPVGIALTDEQHRRDMELLKDMGANFIRISHYPQDDAILEMCDRMGFIAWEEIPVIDFVPVSDAFADNADTMLREMIRRHRNHPSVAMWGYMNEILLRAPAEDRDETVARTLALARRLQDVVKQEDPTRLTAMAFHGSDTYNDAGLTEITDVRGWNLYQGWYGGQLDEFEKYLTDQHRRHPSHRLIVSEYGAGSDLRLHSLHPAPFDFSMEYQQQYLEHYLPVIEDSAYIAGASHWNLIDFSSANRAESMPHINNKGLLTNDRRKKDVYHYYRARWHDAARDTVVHIASRDWPDRTEIVGTEGYVTRPIKVYTNLPEVEMRVNGRSCGIRRADNATALFDVALRPGVNLIEAIAGGRTQDAMSVALRAIPRTATGIDPGTADLGINAGSDCYYRSDESGLTWLPDAEYSPATGYGHIGGRRAVTQDTIAMTADGPLLQTSIAGLNAYRIDVVPGEYEVELSFADPAKPSALSAYMLGHNSGSGDGLPAVMDIAINGRTVERAFSPAATARPKSRVTRRYRTTVAPGTPLTIDFNAAIGGSTSLSAIKIRKIW